ncbi:hypothetical protein GALMADRAFT_703330 [Galerina marginata CBS 339.88]|uniref:Structural maintenance of chromosomes protein 5 n=1 Tax=Galerina marginata (strain CBS 339.88) TaxID=685588 RepID=A0A067TM35_GALM3|nr:hypothetical protein GALMADRAFT_703330 [Galerina marginata CBS 339.88]
MPRRATTPGSSENPRVKQEKTKVKEEKDKGKRRAHVEEEEEQHDEDQDAEGEEEDAPGEPDNEEEDEEAESGSPRGSKRRRTNGEGDSAPSGSGSQQQPRGKVKTLPRGDDGYIPGSIVRIQLHNFVTYDYVQFFPGPYLNMIVGPNGTGKSSIACAIALGLNFPPALLGRATDLNSYVKNGESAGYIEIELKGPKGRNNLVIRRSLKSDSKSSSFMLNGSAATGNEIKSKVSELNVQVGNLCSFLPQDRVSEFAAMSPQQLLRETQRAAGDENLTKWHDTLISAGQELRGVQQTIKDEENSLQQMKDRNQGIERDVQRYKERKKIEHAIALLEVLVPVAEYRESREKFVEVKALQRKLHANVQKLKDKNAPAHDLLKQFEHDFKRADSAREALKKSTQVKFKELTSKNRASDDLETESNSIVEQLTTLKAEDRNRQKAIKSLQNEIAKLEEDLAKPPPEDLADEEELINEAKQINLEKQAYSKDRSEVDAQRKALVDKKVEAEYTLKQREAELKQEDNADNQKLNSMSRWDKATFQAIKWLRANRNLFKMEVFETPFMRVTVKDKNFTNAVEACFGSHLKTFVTQCQEDCDTLNKHINDDQIFGKGMKITTWFRAHQDNLVPPPMSDEEMQGMGFNGYAINYLEFPEGMRWFLMRELNLHRTAIALKNIDVNRAMELVSRPIPRLHPGGATFISGSTMNIVTRSRYGQKAIGNMTRDLQAARNLTTPTIDPAVKNRIEESMREARQDIEMAEQGLIPFRKAYTELDEQEAVITKKIASVKKRREAIKKEAARIQSAKSKLESKKGALEGHLKKPPVDEQRMQLKKKLKVTARKRYVHALAYTNIVHEIIQEQKQCTLVGIRYLQVAANKAALQALCDRKDQKYQSTLLEYTKANELFQRIKAESREILTRSRDIVENSSDEVKDEYAELEKVRMQYDKEVKEAKENGLPPPDDSEIDKRSVEDLQAELETQRANLEMNLNTNPGVVEQYEKRKRDIEQLERTLEERKKREEKIAKDIKSARDNWHPALQSLVTSIGEKFSAAFDRIGCAGEIRINENEDYEKWAIDILVKFRDNEKLQLLTAHRQSGGERSLTTILYLMSLTEEARAPFSLVDEINQGMDQRAERVVHNSMVNVTCQAESAQYFLITPKLLPDLEYHERMKILCVNNGEWLPEVRGIGRMSDMIDVWEARRRGGRGAL